MSPQCHPPCLVGLNPTNHSGADVVWRFSSWPPWRQSWISERNDFSNSKYLHCSDGDHLGYQNGTILANLNLYVALMPSIKFRLNLTYGFGGNVVWRFQYGHRSGHLGFQNRMILAFLNLYVTVIPPIKFPLNRTYGLGGNLAWRISRWPP